MTKEFKVGRLVRIKKLADSRPDGYGHKIRDVGVISGVRDGGVAVVVSGRVSTSGFAPAVSYRESDLILL